MPPPQPQFQPACSSSDLKAARNSPQDSGPVFAATVFSTCAGNDIIEPAVLYILFELLVQEIVEMFAKLLRKLPSIFRRQLADRFSNFSHRPHYESVTLPTNPDKGDN